MVKVEIKTSIEWRQKYILVLLVPVVLVLLLILQSFVGMSAFYWELLLFFFIAV
jgi:hypothetical protein